MRKTDRKIYLYNRNRVIYTDNNKLYIRYNNKYVLLTTIKGGRMQYPQYPQYPQYNMGASSYMAKKEADEAEAKKKAEEAEEVAKKEADKAIKEAEAKKKAEAKEKAEAKDKKDAAAKEKKYADNEDEKQRIEYYNQARNEKKDSEYDAKMYKKDADENKAKKKKDKEIEKEDKDKEDNEAEEKKAEILRNYFQSIFDFMLTNAMTKCDKYYTYINVLCVNTYSILENEDYTDEERKKIIEKYLYLTFFKYYMTEIIREGIYSSYIIFINNRVNIDNNFQEIIIDHSTTYIDNFNKLKQYWKNQKKDMGETVKLKIEIATIEWENNELYKEEHDDSNLKKKLNNAKANPKDLKFYADFIISFFKYIAYTSFKKEFDDIKNYVRTY